MAAVTYASGTERSLVPTGESSIKVWVSPASMDSADTVVLPTITGKTVHIISAFDMADGTHVTATLVSQTVTLDAGGAATNSVYVLTYTHV